MHVDDNKILPDLTWLNRNDSGIIVLELSHAWMVDI